LVSQLVVQVELQVVLQGSKKGTQGTTRIHKIPPEVFLTLTWHTVGHKCSPHIDVMLERGHKEKPGIALAKWFHANDIPRRG
jgi:hypothetical protein